MDLRHLLLFVFCFQLAHFTIHTRDSLHGAAAPCVIELECAECIPDNMPLVTSHRAANGSVVVPPGERVTLSCGAGHFVLYPRATISAVCDAGRYRVDGDGPHIRLLDLGCQQNIFEDVLHQVDNCAPPFQGRAYQMRDGSSPGVRHLATVCFDEDRATAVWSHMTNTAHNTLPLPAHADHTAPLSILGNFNQMFDANTRHEAERLYSDDLRMNRRLHELLKHTHFTFAEQTLTSAKLLSSHYFEDQNMRVTDFVSNRVPVWRSVARGNLQHMQQDVARLLRSARGEHELHVYTGVHGVLSVRGGHEAVLKAGGRFPVPRYVWAVLHARRARRAAALVLLNDPFVSVSELHGAAFCDSACARLPWLRTLRNLRNYEVPLYGLTFCCNVHNFTAVVTHLQGVVDVPLGNEGLLTDLFN